MNKIYRLKFDKRRNELVVVSEITAGMGKEKSTGHIADLSALSPFRKLLGTLTPLALLTGLIISLFPGMALANPDLPTGGQIVGGQGSISTSGNQMTIHQQTQNMATNWHSFDVGQNNTVQFVQPDSSSVALNRVTGVSGSQIMGTLKANGQVFILNPNGVLFGKDARVNVAGLVASTKNINTADFMKGQYTLSGSGTSGAQVINQGSLTTSKGGYIVLAGERVSNSGTVTTPGGKTVLAAGKTVTLQLDNGGLTSVSVNGSVVNALVENRGLISATNGQVYLTAKGQDMLLNTVVNNSGTIEAKGLESRGGEIVLNGGDSGVVSQSGQLLADSLTGQGGKITLEGQNIHLADSSLTSASGKTGGGEVYVGGGWQGKDSVIKNASKVVMDKTATVDVSATDAGNGGTAVLWSDDYTNFRGAVLAKGGAQSGNGGRVETSSHNNLQAFGEVNTSARAGHGGEWLLDPMDVTIVTAGNNTSVTETGKDAGGAGLDSSTDHVFSPSASGAQVSATKIQEQLNNGTSVTVDTHGGEGTAKGNITIANNVNITKNVDKGDATLTLLADNNIQLGSDPNGHQNTNITISSTSGKLHLKLLAGKTVNDGSAKVLLGQKTTTISLNGGDFTVASAQDGGKINFLAPHGNGETISAGSISITAMGTQGMNTFGVSLNATGNIDISASKITSESTWGQNVTWRSGDHLTITSDGAVSFLANDKDDGVGGGGNTALIAEKDVVITGRNGTVTFDGNGSKANSGVNITSSDGSVSLSGMVQNGTVGLNLDNVNITSKDKVTLNGTTFWGWGTALTTLNITAGGDVGISGVAKNLLTGMLGGASSRGIKLSGGSISSTGGNITLSGIAATHKSHPGIHTLDISNSNFTATGKIELNGTTATTTGLSVSGSNFSAASMVVKGVATTQGKGFSLTNTHLLGSLQNLSNVTFSSAGSGAGVINILDNSIAGNTATRDILFAKNIENMTSVDMNGTAIFDDTKESVKGWSKDYTHEGKGAGWIFNNTEVKAGGDVILKGVGFTNSTVNVTSGNLDINNTGPALLTGTNVTVSNGCVSVHSDAGDIDLVKGNISAKNDITLNASAGGITISGVDENNVANITSTDGNITLNGKGGTTGETIRNASLIAKNGKINIDGSARLGAFDAINVEQGAVLLYGQLLFSSGGGTTINATHSSVVAGYSPPAPLVLERVNLTFDGGAEINACGSYAGIILSASDFVKPTESKMIVKNGDVKINAILDGNAQTGPTGAAGSSASGGIVFNNGDDGRVSLELNVDKGSNVTINADSSANKSGAFAAFAAATPESTSAAKNHNGFVFSGGGNISVRGTSDSADAVNLRLFNNENLTGNLVITGVSDSGVGVNFDKYLSTKVSNATITGSSASGVGVQMTAKDGSADLNGNSISGSTVTGQGGVILSGSNVTITNGTLTGNASGGKGSGVSLVGGSNFVLDRADVRGHAVDGSGISVNGTLTVNNGTQVVGEAMGSGDGVVVSGNLITDTGDGVTLNGTASSGDGIKVAGDAVLAGATLKGQTRSGNGVNIAGNLTTDSSTQVQGQSTGQGTGVTLGASLAGGRVNGVSEQGTGLQLADNAVVTDASLKGESVSGSGVAVTGNISLDDTTAAGLNATSVSGAGLSLENNANVSIVNISTVTQEKHDAEGNPVLGTNGKAVIETVTTTKPVTAPVTLTGVSQNGSGVVTSGNVSISGVLLNGSATAAEGTGATLGGNLTIADNISGVTVNATGSATALVVDNVTINANDYTGTGKDFVINASTSDSDGTAIKTQGNNQLGGVTLNGTASNGGTAVELGGQVSGGQITGTSDSGAGLNVSGNVSLSNAVVTGTTETGTGAVVSGAVTADEHSEVNGAATAGGGTGVHVSGAVTGGTVTGSSTTGDAVHITDGAQISGADIRGTSQDGSAIRTEGQVSVSNSQLSGHSVNGADLEVSGTLSHDVNTKIDAETVVGHENVQEVKPDTSLPPEEEGDTDHHPDSGSDKPAEDNPVTPSGPGDEQQHEHNASLRKQAEVNSLRRDAVNAQVMQMNQPSRAGFEPAGTSPVPVKGWQAPDKKVDIRLCDGEGCRSVSLDTGKPADEKTTPSGR
ncbi:filamentous hemagglutinin N-terminal domain-containing protein [Salmonella enterica]|nr:filamentous hemagglutinin N-terminal domain-containing protein [Salmonella enterica]